MADTRRPPRRHRETSPAALELLRHAQDSDRDTFGRLYTEHLDLVTRHVAVRLRGRDRDVIPDVVHDAFTDALTDLVSAGQDVTGWFLQLAARACTRHHWATRRYLRAAHEINDHAVLAMTSAPAQPPVTAVGVWMTILAAMTRLTDNQRTAIRLRYLDGYPRDRAAEVMGRSTHAVRDLERRGLRRLNAVLALPPTDATAAVAR